MDTQPPGQKIKFQHGSYQEHRRQALRQIWLPLGFGILLALTLAVLGALTSAADSQSGLHLANISLIALLVPVMFAGIIALALLIIAVYGLAKLLKVAPIYTLKAQAFIYRLTTSLMIWGDKPARPFIQLQSWWAGWFHFLEYFRSKEKRAS